MKGTFQQPRVWARPGVRPAQHRGRKGVGQGSGLDPEDTGAIRKSDHRGPACLYLKRVTGSCEGPAWRAGGAPEIPAPAPTRTPHLAAQHSPAVLPDSQQVLA